MTKTHYVMVDGNNEPLDYEGLATEAPSVGDFIAVSDRGYMVLRRHWTMASEVMSDVEARHRGYAPNDIVHVTLVVSRVSDVVGDG